MPPGLVAIVGDYVREFSHYFDLSGLDGVTVAFDYRDALLRLDRGRPDCSPLTPSDNGVAMAARVRRDGALRSHIVVDAAYVYPLADRDHPDFAESLHGLAHECAHVEITKKFDTCIPGFLFNTRWSHDPRDLHRQGIWISCWEEYEATRLSARFGRSPSETYKDYLVECLKITVHEANERIAAYRLHHDVDQVLSDVYSVYGRALKLASYFYGDAAGQGALISDLRASEYLHFVRGTWFEEHFYRLAHGLETLADRYGCWTSLEEFEEISLIIDEMVVDGGVITIERADGSFYIDVPFSPETEPGYYGI